MGDIALFLQSVPDNVTAEIGPTAAWLAGILVAVLGAALAYLRKELQDARAQNSALQERLDSARKETLLVRDAWDTKETQIRGEHRQRLLEHDERFRELMGIQVSSLQSMQAMLNNQSQQRHEELVAIIKAMGEQFSDLAAAIRDHQKEDERGG